MNTFLCILYHVDVCVYCYAFCVFFCCSCVKRMNSNPTLGTSSTDFSSLNKNSSSSNSGTSSGSFSFGTTTNKDGSSTTKTTSHSVPGTKHLKNHYDHQHLQGYNPSIRTHRAPLNIKQRPLNLNY